MDDPRYLAARAFEMGQPRLGVSSEDRDPGEADADLAGWSGPPTAEAWLTTPRPRRSALLVDARPSTALTGCRTTWTGPSKK